MLACANLRAVILIPLAMVTFFGCGTDRSTPSDPDGGTGIDSATNDASIDGGFSFHADTTAYANGAAWIAAYATVEHDVLTAQCECGYADNGYSSIEMCVTENTTSTDEVQSECYGTSFDAASSNARAYLSCVTRVQDQIDECIRSIGCAGDYSVCLFAEEGQTPTQADVALAECETATSVSSEEYDAVAQAYASCVEEHSAVDCATLSCAPVECSCAEPSDTCGTGATTFNFTSCSMGVCGTDANAICPGVCATTGRVYRPSSSVFALTETGTWTDLELPSSVEVFSSPVQATEDTFYVLGATGYPMTINIRNKVFRVRENVVEDVTPNLSSYLSDIVNARIWGVTNGIQESGDDFVVLVNGRTESYNEVSRVFLVDGASVTMLYDSGIEHSIEIRTIERDRESTKLYIPLLGVATGAVRILDLDSLAESDVLLPTSPSIRSFLHFYLSEDVGNLVWVYSDNYLFRVDASTATPIELPAGVGGIRSMDASRDSKITITAGLFGRDVWTRSDAGVWEAVCLPERLNTVARYDDEGALWLENYRYSGGVWRELPEGRAVSTTFGSLGTTLYVFEASPSVGGARLSRLSM